MLARLGRLVARGVLGFPGLSVRPYGSFVSGLYSPGGDLDVALDGFLDYRCSFYASSWDCSFPPIGLYSPGGDLNMALGGFLDDRCSR